MTWRLSIHTWILLAILVFAGTLRLARLNEPFARDPEGCASFYGLLARNYFRYDWATTWGVPVMSMGQGAEADFYAKHPPATPLLIAAVYFMTGYRGEWDPLPGEWQARLPTALFTLACIVVIYHMVKRRATPRAALIAAAIFASIPLTLIFGGFPDVISPQLSFFALLTVAAYERFHNATNARSFTWLCLTFLGAALTDWPAYYLVPVLGTHFIFTRHLRAWGWMVGLALVSITCFFAMYAYLAIAQQDWRWMTTAIEHRAMRNVADSQRAYTMGGWFEQAIWNYGIARHTLVVCVLGVLWLPLAVARSFRAKCDRLTGLLLSWALLHILVGRQGVYQHEWWWWPLTPGIVIAAALTIEQVLILLEERFPSRAWNIIITCLVLAFAGYNWRSVEIERASYPLLSYSLVEFGQVIRDHTPPDAAAVLADSDSSLAFWYYADRAVKRRVWDRATKDKRIADQIVDGPFDHWQKWTGPTSTVIIPRVYVSDVLPFIEYLDGNFVKRETGNFVVYDLRAEGRGQRAEGDVPK